MKEYINEITNILINSTNVEIEAARQKQDKETITYLRGRKQGIVLLSELINEEYGKLITK